MKLYCLENVSNRTIIIDSLILLVLFDLSVELLPFHFSTFNLRVRQYLVHIGYDFDYINSSDFMAFIDSRIIRVLDNSTNSLK